MPAPEENLLRAARGGDAAAFAALLRDERPGLERLALRLVRHRQDAEDVLQETVLAAWRRLPGFRGRARFRTWLTRILVRKALDLLRRRRAPPLAALPRPAPPPDPLVEVAGREFEERVRAAIEALPPVQRTTLLLRADRGLSYREIAYVLGTSRDAVRMNLIAARKRLHAWLEGGEGGGA